MKFFNRKNKKETEQRFIDEYQNPILGTLNFHSLTSYTASKSLKLSAVYRCVNLISDSIASLPLNPYYFKDNWKYIDYSNTLYNILNVQPNSNMSAYTFKKMIVTNMLLKGNTFILIDRTPANIIKSLTLLPSDNIAVFTENGEIKYKEISTKRVFDKSEIIHILNYSENGVVGISTLTYAADALSISYESEQHTKNWFSGGATLAGILRPIAGVNLTKDKAIKAKTDFVNSLTTEFGGKSNSIVVLDSGLEYQSISLNPRESQLLESRQFNVIDICRFFNVPPSLAFSETGKFSTAEQQQLDYLNNTLTPIIEKLESEFFRKLYLPSEFDTHEIKFDTENLLRLDAVTKADYFTKMYQIGAYTTNEIREKINAGYPVVGGNRAFNQVNLQPLDNLVVEQPKDNTNQIDNKLK